MNQKLKKLALEVGGSHYPEVSRGYLLLTVKLVLEDAIKELELNGYDDAAKQLAVHTKSYEQDN